MKYKKKKGNYKYFYKPEESAASIENEEQSCIHKNYQVMKNEGNFYVWCLDCKRTGKETSTEKRAILLFFIEPKPS